MKKKLCFICRLLVILLIVLSTSQSTTAEATVSNNSKAGVTLKLKEETPVNSETELTKEKETSSKSNGGGNSQPLPSTGELAGLGGVWSGLGLVLVIGVLFLLKRHRKR